MRRTVTLFPSSSLRGFACLAALACLASNSLAAPPQAVREIVRSDSEQLDALFAAGTANDLPTGFLPGRVIVDPGSRRTAAKSRRMSLLWQGKVFHGDGTAHNRVFGITAVPMTVYPGESWHDGAPAIIVDYSNSWRIFRNVRDEIREVSPGLYLGRTFVQKRSGTEQVAMFVLASRESR
ncbi:MAG TPA: hypothetical protein VLM40_13145 [Gemmata sp.]|nr:hypothetical protein [Gemmata sp.]